MIRKQSPLRSRTDCGRESIIVSYRMKRCRWQRGAASQTAVATLSGMSTILNRLRSRCAPSRLIDVRSDLYAGLHPVPVPAVTHYAQDMFEASEQLTASNRKGDCGIPAAMLAEAQTDACRALCTALRLPVGWQRGGGLLRQSRLDSFSVVVSASKAASIVRIQRRRFTNADEQLRLTERLVVYVTQPWIDDMGRANVERVLRVLHVKQLRVLPVAYDVQARNYPVDMEVVETQVAEDVMNGFIPSLVVCSVASGATCAVDPVDRLASLLGQRLGAWVHVDASEAGSAGLSLREDDRHMSLWSGVEQCDSLYVAGSSMGLGHRIHALLSPTKTTEMEGAVVDGGEFGWPVGLALREVLSKQDPSEWNTLAVQRMDAAVALEEALRCCEHIEVQASAAMFGAVVFRLHVVADEVTLAWRDQLRNDYGIAVSVVAVLGRPWLKAHIPFHPVEVTAAARLRDAIVTSAARLQRT